MYKYKTYVLLHKFLILPFPSTSDTVYSPSFDFKGKTKLSISRNYCFNMFAQPCVVLRWPYISALTLRFLYIRTLAIHIHRYQNTKSTIHWYQNTNSTIHQYQSTNSTIHRYHDTNSTIRRYKYTNHLQFTDISTLTIYYSLRRISEHLLSTFIDINALNLLFTDIRTLTLLFTNFNALNLLLTDISTLTVYN